MYKLEKSKGYLVPIIIEIISIQPRKNQCNTGSGNLNFCSNGTGE